MTKNNALAHVISFVVTKQNLVWLTWSKRNDVAFFHMQKMIEKYHRNPNKPANEDVSELIFLVAEEKILVTYHTQNSKISASTREFVKPPNAEGKGALLIMSPDMHSTFQVRIPNSRPKAQLVRAF